MSKELLELLAEQNIAMNRSFMKGYQKGYAAKERELKEQENEMVEKMYQEEQKK
jgi:hypothetical protein